MFTLLEHMGDDRTLLQMQRLPNTTPVDLVYRTDRVASRFAQPILNEAKYLQMEDVNTIYHMMVIDRSVANHIQLRMYFDINIRDWGAVYDDMTDCYISLFYITGTTHVSGILTAGLFDLYVFQSHIDKVVDIPIAGNITEHGKYVAPATWNVLEQLYNREKQNG